MKQSLDYIEIQFDDTKHKIKSNKSFRVYFKDSIVEMEKYLHEYGYIDMLCLEHSPRNNTNTRSKGVDIELYDDNIHEGIKISVFEWFEGQIFIGYNNERVDFETFLLLCKTLCDNTGDKSSKYEEYRIDDIFKTFDIIILEINDSYSGVTCRLLDMIREIVPSRGTTRLKV